MNAAGPHAPDYRVPFVRTHNRWTVADEWFAEFIRTLESSAGRVTRLRREARRGIPKAEYARRDYDTETENYRRFLRHQENIA